jgi:Icc-related predicted phosphoesterase
MPKIVFISDTHGLHGQMQVPEGDILVHAGDMTNVGRINEVAALGVWLREMEKRFKFIVIVAGNHDWLFQKNRALAESLINQGTMGEATGKIIYLQDSGVTIDGLKIHGSPQTPWFFDWAFNVRRGELKPYWDKIPEGLDILITHGPPSGILDQADPHLGSEHVGCEELMEAVERTKPKIHVFGHIHGGYGKMEHVNTTFINASICDERYKPINAPWVIDMEPRDTHGEEK